MADYTKYSAPAPEWVEFEKTLNPPALPSDAEEAKALFNSARAAMFAKVLGPIGSYVRLCASLANQ
jgi:hypothetical protein